MWIINVILIVSALISITWFVQNFGDDFLGAISVIISGFKSILFVLCLILFQAVKAGLAGAVVGGICWGIFKVAGAPIKIINSTSLTIGVLFCIVMMAKFVIEDWNNLIRTFRHDIKNTYRKQHRRH